MIAVVLVLCLVAALIMSPLGIFFNGEEIGGQTIADAVRKINQEYSAKLEELKSGAAYDQLSMTGASASWPEVLAVYAVKTTSDPTNGPQDGVPDHVEIVEKVENGRVCTVEGNSGDKYCQRSYPVGYYEIQGFGMLNHAITNPKSF